jgi:hypothetical protein
MGRSNGQYFIDFSDASERIRKASEIVTEIFEASQEQVKGIEQINQALFNISRVTQQNAINSQDMVSIVNRFQLTDKLEEQDCTPCGEPDISRMYSPVRRRRHEETKTESLTARGSVV